MKDKEILKIKCPECGAVLTVEYRTGCETKTLTCPVCKKTHLFSEFKLYKAHSDEEKTDVESKQQRPGKLTCCGKVYSLNNGVNTIGRKAPSSQASLQIYTTDKYMSRLHAEIRFEKGFHFFRVLSNKNETRVNGQLVGLDDCMILQNGDMIKLANTDLKFLIDDDDMTLL